MIWIIKVEHLGNSFTLVISQKFGQFDHSSFAGIPFMNERLLELVTKNKELILIGLICGVGMGIVGLAFTIAEVLWR